MNSIIELLKLVKKRPARKHEQINYYNFTILSTC